MNTTHNTYIKTKPNNTNTLVAIFIINLIYDNNNFAILFITKVLSSISGFFLRFPSTELLASRSWSSALTSPTPSHRTTWSWTHLPFPTALTPRTSLAYRSWGSPKSESRPFCWIRALPWWNPWKRWWYNIFCLVIAWCRIVGWVHHDNPRWLNYFSWVFCPSRSPL